MSRLDYFTIIIVTVCVVALIYLVVNIVKLKNKDQPGIDSTLMEKPETTPEAEGVYAPDDSSAYPNSSQASGMADDYDPDDDEVDFIDPGAEPFGDESSASGSGTPVEERQPVPSTSPAVENRPASSAAAHAGDYMVLAGSYRIMENAETEVKKLKRLGYNNAEVTIFNKGTYATVLVDRFTTADQAAALVKELKNKHSIDSYVKKK